MGTSGGRNRNAACLREREQNERTGDQQITAASFRRDGSAEPTAHQLELLRRPDQGDHGDEQRAQRGQELHHHAALEDDGRGGHAGAAHRLRLPQFGDAAQVQHPQRAQRKAAGRAPLSGRQGRAGRGHLQDEHPERLHDPGDIGDCEPHHPAGKPQLHQDAGLLFGALPLCIGGHAAPRQRGGCAEHRAALRRQRVGGAQRRHPAQGGGELGAAFAPGRKPAAGHRAQPR